jgi:hypothetical protein
MGKNCCRDVLARFSDLRVMVNFGNGISAWFGVKPNMYLD